MYRPIKRDHTFHFKSSESLHDPSAYQRLVPRSIYLTITRLDMLYDISVISQFIHAPRIKHLVVVHRIFRCLKGAPRQGIVCACCGHLSMEAYTNADWAGSETDGRSTIGFLYTLVVF